MFEPISIQSHTGVYQVDFKDNLDFLATLLSNENHYFILDENIQRLYSKEFSSLPESRKILFQATEEKKDLTEVAPLIEVLTKKGFKRNHKLFAVGGGITQDVTCFIASILYRGVEWEFIPTTLLAQGDSCIGSKSSINCSGVKNLVGNFYPPKKIHLCLKFLKTLEREDVKSGIAEIVKVFLVKGLKEAAEIAAASPKFENLEELKPFLYRGLHFKKEIIEVDEFDRGIRNVMNYGHTFGHAIEKAAHYKIPHGIAVAIGMDMANLYSMKTGMDQGEAYKTLHPCLSALYSSKTSEKIVMDEFFQAIQSDKKNSGGKIHLILPHSKGHHIQRTPTAFDEGFKNFCLDFFKTTFRG